MFFKCVSKNYSHNIFSFLGIKFKIKSKKYKMLKKYFPKSIVKDFGCNNKVVISKPALLLRSGGGGNYSKLRVSFYGNNNTVFLTASSELALSIEIFGDDNIIDIGENAVIKSSSIGVGSQNSKVSNTKILIANNVNFLDSSIKFGVGHKQSFEIGHHSCICNSHFDMMENALLKFGNNVSLSKSEWFCLNKNAKVLFGNEITCNSLFINLSSNCIINIGDDCMLSWNVVFIPHDSHTILDSSGNVLNPENYEINIGKHCWLGYGSTFIHNAQIKENSIVGINTLVNKKFDESGVMLAGSPAKIIKRNVNWDRVEVGDYK